MTRIKNKKFILAFCFYGGEKTSFSAVLIEHHSYSKTFSLPSALTINTYNSMSYIKLPLTANIKKGRGFKDFYCYQEKLRFFFIKRVYYKIVYWWQRP